MIDWISFRLNHDEGVQQPISAKRLQVNCVFYVHVLQSTPLICFKLYNKNREIVFLRHQKQTSDIPHVKFLSIEGQMWGNNCYRGISLMLCIYMHIIYKYKYNLFYLEYFKKIIIQETTLDSLLRSYRSSSPSK